MVKSIKGGGIVNQVLPATEDDLSVVLGWLKREYEQNGDGFWCNRKVITRSFHEDHNLWAIREDDKAIAFQVGDYGTDVVCVRKDRRGQGCGTAFVRFSVDRASKNDVNVLKGECSPTDS